MSAPGRRPLAHLRFGGRPIAHAGDGEACQFRVDPEDDAGGDIAADADAAVLGLLAELAQQLEADGGELRRPVGRVFLVEEGAEAAPAEPEVIKKERTEKEGEEKE